LNLGIGPSYFMEIAKFKAARILWSNLLKVYGANEESKKIFIHAQTSTFNNSKLDPNVNILRATTETFSAIIGNVDSIETLPYDFMFSKQNEFSSRLARNTQIILKEESHLDSIIDPVGGSYYVETLTQEIATAVWTLFKSIENEGGFLNSIKDGFVQSEIENTRLTKHKDYAKRKSVLVGTNKYSNPKEENTKMEEFDKLNFKEKRAKYLQHYRVDGKAEKHSNILSKLNSVANSEGPELINLASSAILDGATIGEVTKIIRSGTDNSISVKSLDFSRASVVFENLRSSAELTKTSRGFYPKVFLATMGKLKEYKGRADFSRAFFETGSFDIEYPNGYESVEDVVADAIKSNADAIVICSTDLKYPKIVPQIIAKLKSKNSDVSVILAGYPKDQISEHKESGVDDFIYLGCNALSILGSLLSKINKKNS